MAVKDFKEKKELEILQESKQIYEWVFKDKIFYFYYNSLSYDIIMYKAPNSIKLVLVFSKKKYFIIYQLYQID